MICDSCQQNLATVHLTEIVQKQKKETHLCEECARTRGVPTKESPTPKEFLGALGKEQPEPASEPVKAEAKIPPCPSCGLTFADFRSSGRLGCHHDYEHFKALLLPFLERIHGSTQHRGRVPSRVGQRLERERLVAGYRRELDEAVLREDYEQAAQLRDKIRALEQAEKTV